MGPFSASLKVPGDRSSLAATLSIEDGRLQIKAGDQDIGDWSLSEIDLNRLDGGYRMTAEGEQLFIEVQDLTGFDAAVDENTRGRRRFQRKRSPKLPKTEAASSEPVAPIQVKPAEPAKPVEEPQKTTAQKAEPEGNRVLTFVDGLVEKAEKRFGALLPEWIFTRWTVLVIVLLLLLALVLPGLVANILLFGGLGIVVFGAVLYTDDRMAAKILPGRSTPTHVLISGVGLLMIGVVIGLIAKG